MDIIDYAVKLVGVDHVGFGLDFCPLWDWDPAEYERWARLYPTLAPAKLEERMVKDLEHVSDVKNISRGLVARGYTDEDIMKLLSGNFLELFRKVWNP